MRLRPLTEAECYARCYGGVRTEQVSIVRPPAPPDRERAALARVRRAAAERHKPREEAA